MMPYKTMYFVPYGENTTIKDIGVLKLSTIIYYLRSCSAHAPFQIMENGVILSDSGVAEFLSAHIENPVDELENNTLFPTLDDFVKLPPYKQCVSAVYKTPTRESSYMFTVNTFVDEEYTTWEYLQTLMKGEYWLVVTPWEFSSSVKRFRFDKIWLENAEDLIVLETLFNNERETIFSISDGDAVYGLAEQNMLNSNNSGSIVLDSTSIVSGVTPSTRFGDGGLEIDENGKLILDLDKIDVKKGGKVLKNWLGESK
tara:strand:- start:432 stop:1199 length:768 start_codon:yes stop_codon:yes gene_type:complete